MCDKSSINSTMLCHRAMLITVIAFLALCPVLSTGTVIGTTNNSPLSHSAILGADNHYHIAWDFDDHSITFEVSVETRGYIGLGFSPNGDMAGSDIVIGWVDDSTGMGHISDRHAVGRSEPLVDKDQDYTLLHSSQNDSHTVLRFSRHLDLCNDEDHDIKDETVRLIWAFSDTDPTPTGSIHYHGTNRGNKNTYLLNPQGERPPIPANVIHEDFLNPNVTIPSTSTTYWCQSFPIPRLDRKHHVIKFEPIIQPGHESEVHHILLYACYHPVQNESFNKGHECYHRNMPADFHDCTSTIFAWAIGGGSQYLPANAGLPFGYEGDPTMLLMETHYDNPTGKEGVVDSSGFRITLTPDLREHDAGVLNVGEVVWEAQIIPPYSESFRTSGNCFPECLSQAMATQPQGINVFGSVLHSHLLGHALRVRHFREGNEQPLLSQDNNYDFNYQDFRILKEEVVIRPGDHLVVECDYRTKHLTNLTVGGLSTKEEMCLAFLMYYPKIKLGICQSAPVIQYSATVINATTDRYGVITSPEKYAGRDLHEVLNNEVDWTNKTIRDAYQQLINQDDVDAFFVLCTEGDNRYPVSHTVLPLPKKILTLPNMTDPICDRPTAPTTAKPQNPPICDGPTCGAYQPHVGGFLLLFSALALLMV